MDKEYNISIVAAGFNISMEDFKSFLKYHTDLKLYEFRESQYTININSDIEPPKELIERIKKQLPVRVYKSKNNKITINHVIQESKLIITCQKFNELNLEEIKMMCKAIISEKIDSVFAIGSNFMVENTINYKLRLLNNQISTINNWSKNLGFQLVLPIQENENVVATYKIEKAEESIPDDTQNDSKHRLYRVTANFNYNLKANENKLETVNTFLEDTFNNYYNHFKETNDKFLSIGQSTND